MGTVSTKLSCTERPPEIELAPDCLYVALRDLFPFLLLCLGYMSVRRKAMNWSKCYRSLSTSRGLCSTLRMMSRVPRTDTMVYGITQL